MDKHPMTSDLPDWQRAPSDALKKRAFDLLMDAWSAYDAVIEDNDDAPASRVTMAVELAVQSIAILYSGSLDAEPRRDLLNHLIARNPLFGSCDRDFVDRYLYWKAQPEAALKNGKPTRAFKKFLRATETLLSACEDYNFELRRRIYYTHEEHVLLSRRNRSRMFKIGLLAALFLVLYPIYRAVHPVLKYDTKGQFFWRTVPTDLESEAKSLRFKVHADGRFHDYTIDTVEPIKLISLRFDPLITHEAKVWIDTIEIHQDGDLPPIRFDFDKDAGPWSPMNHTTGFTFKDGSLFFETTGADPAINNSRLVVERLSAIKLRMKVLTYKSYVQWIFS